MNALIEEARKEMIALCSPKYTYRTFDIEKKAKIIKLKGCTLQLRGRDIEEHLIKSDKVILMAVTLGVEVDRKLAYYTRTHLSKAVILDACGTVLVEEICDQLEKEIGEIYKKVGMHATSRYSPGYGDFSLAIQKDLLMVLEAYKKIGLSATEESILLPRKSVTAVIGLQKEEHINKKNSCEVCTKLECNFRRGGEGCGQRL